MQHFVQQIKSFRLEIWTKLLELDGDPLLPLYLVNLKVRLVLRKLNLRDVITADGRDGQNGLGWVSEEKLAWASTPKAHHVGPDGFVWRAEQLENARQLVSVRSARKQRAACRHLSKDATNAPQVHWS